MREGGREGVRLGGRRGGREGREGGRRGGTGSQSVPTAEDAGGDTDRVRQHRVREGGVGREGREGRGEGGAGSHSLYQLLKTLEEILTEYDSIV